MKHSHIVSTQQPGIQTRKIALPSFPLMLNLQYTYPKQPQAKKKQKKLSKSSDIILPGLLQASLNNITCCYTSDRNVRLRLVHIVSRGVS